MYNTTKANLVNTIETINSIVAAKNDELDKRFSALLEEYRNDIQTAYGEVKANCNSGEAVGEAFASRGLTCIQLNNATELQSIIQSSPGATLVFLKEATIDEDEGIVEGDGGFLLVDPAPEGQYIYITEGIGDMRKELAPIEQELRSIGQTVLHLNKWLEEGGAELEDGAELCDMDAGLGFGTLESLADWVGRNTGEATGNTVAPAPAEDVSAVV
jgi:hypothetical protein